MEIRYYNIIHMKYAVFTDQGKDPLQRNADGIFFWKRRKTGKKCDRSGYGYDAAENSQYAAAT